MSRIDIHRPSAIVPEEYEFVAHDYYGPDSQFMDLSSERAWFREHMKRTGGKFSGHEHGGSCHVCGASALYVAKFYHAKTNSYIVTGEDCADKMHIGDPAAFRKFRDKVHVAKEAAAGKRKAEKTLIDAGLVAAWDVYMNANHVDANGRVLYEENTIKDIVSKLVKYGHVSDKSLTFVGKLLKQIPERAAKLAERTAQHDAALPIPVLTGRVRIEGTILTVKEPDAYATFPAYKLLVQHADGWKVWGSRPASLFDAKVGDRVTFEAMVKVSDNDPKFGFFSRPTKAKVI